MIFPDAMKKANDLIMNLIIKSYVDSIHDLSVGYLRFGPDHNHKTGK
jgi:hypothetical protein